MVRSVEEGMAGRQGGDAAGAERLSVGPVRAGPVRARPLNCADDFSCAPCLLSHTALIR